MACMAVYALVMAAQLACAALNISPWPLMAYNFFAIEPVERARHFRFVLEDADGGQHELEPGHLVPTEFFKAAPHINRSLLQRDADSDRQAYLRALVDRARSQPWSGFDEVWASAGRARLDTARRIHWVLDLEPVDAGDAAAGERQIIQTAQLP